jgi:hypothetical protein
MRPEDDQGELAVKYLRFEVFRMLKVILLSSELTRRDIPVGEFKRIGGIYCQCLQELDIARCLWIRAS